MNIEKTGLEEQLQKIDEKIANAEQEGGDIDIRDALVEKAEVYLKYGDHESYRNFYLKAIDKTAGTQKKLEFYLLVLHSYYLSNNIPKFSEYLTICKNLNDQGGDWEKKNKLLVYDGIMNIIKRDIPTAATLFLSCLNTFNAPEIISFETLVRYAAVLGLLSLSRKEVKDKLISNSEVISVMNEDPLLNDFVFSVYNTNYRDFFKCLINIHDEFIQKDRFLKAHPQYLLKRARIVIYNQYLESYKTVRLDKMAKDFGVSVDFIDKELSELISNKNLSCQIDRVNGIVESASVDSRISMYQDIVKRGDALIERMHKLSKFAYA